MLNLKELLNLNSFSIVCNVFIDNGGLTLSNDTFVIIIAVYFKITNYINKASLLTK